MFDRGEIAGNLKLQFLLCLFLEKKNKPSGNDVLAIGETVTRLYISRGGVAMYDRDLLEFSYKILAYLMISAAAVEFF